MGYRTNYLRALHAEYLDKGDLIAAGWCHLLITAPSGIHPNELENLREMFYAGVAFLRTVTRNGETRDLELIDAELSAHLLLEQDAVGNA